MVESVCFVIFIILVIRSFFKEECKHNWRMHDIKNYGNAGHIKIWKCDKCGEERHETTIY